MSAGRFKLGQRVLVWIKGRGDLCGPATVTRKEFRVFIGASSGLPVTGWGYLTDHMPSDGPWLSESCLRDFPEPAGHEYTAQLLAELGVLQ